MLGWVGFGYVVWYIGTHRYVQTWHFASNIEMVTLKKKYFYLLFLLKKKGIQHREMVSGGMNNIVVEYNNKWTITANRRIIFLEKRWTPQ